PARRAHRHRRPHRPAPRRGRATIHRAPGPAPPERLLRELRRAQRSASSLPEHALARAPPSALLTQPRPMLGRPPAQLIGGEPLTSLPHASRGDANAGLTEDIKEVALDADRGARSLQHLVAPSAVGLAVLLRLDARRAEVALVVQVESIAELVR